MLFGLFRSRTKAQKVRDEARDLLEQARETGEGLLGQVRQTGEGLLEQARGTGGEALATVGQRLGASTVGQRLGVYRPEPARTSGDDALAFINGLVLGIVICAIVAYLLAPTDGQTFRRRLKAQIDALLGRNTLEDTERAAAAAEPQSDTTATDIGRDMR